MKVLRRVWTIARLVILYNPGVKWIFGIVVLLLALAYLPTPLRRNFWIAVDSMWVQRTYHSRLDCRDGNGNDDKDISIELGQMDLRDLMAKAAGLPVWRLEDLSITVTNHEWTSNRNPPCDLYSVIDLYVSSRVAGHTAEYARSVLEAVDASPSASMSFLCDLKQRGAEEIIPESYVSRVKTSAANEQVKVVRFLVVDGDLAWRYSVYYDKTGAFNSSWRTCVDALEFHPESEVLDQQANQAADERMKREGISGMGSIHSFWEFKRQFLRERGYIWRSPSELNPDSNFD